MADQISITLKGRQGAFALDVAFTVPMHGITALFGPSGCGKTTLLRCLAGLDRVPGEILVGTDVWQDATSLRPTHCRAVGYVFQEANLFPHLSVAENLRYGLSRALSRPDLAGHLGYDDLIELLRLSPLLTRMPSALSGGERQRVALGRALLSRPRLLLLDEPLAALDSQTKDEILPYLDQLHALLAVPILYVSHDIAEVARLADHVVMLSEGRVLADGPAATILERLDLTPETGRFEAGVILTVKVKSHDEDFQLTYLDHNGQTIAMPQMALTPDSNIRIRIRARDVALATARPEGISIRNILSGHVAEISEKDGSAFADILVDIGGARLRAQITRAAARDLKLKVGLPVFALVKSVTFDARSYGGA